jgi:hypothetical protein
MRTADLIAGCIKAKLAPEGIIRQMRARIRDYFVGSGQRFPTTLSPAEKKETRRRLVELELMRTFPTVPNGLPCLVNLGPYADVEHAVELKRNTAGETNWLCSNNLKMTGTLAGQYCGPSRMPPPVWFDPKGDDVVRREMSNVIITNVYADGMPNLVCLVDGRFGNEVLLSKFRQPTRPFYIEGDPVSYLNCTKMNSSTADALRTRRQPQIVLHSPSNNLLEKLVDQLWKEQGTWTIVCTNAGRLNLERLERMAIARREAQERRQKAAKSGLDGGQGVSFIGGEPLGGDPFTGRGGGGPSDEACEVYVQDVLDCIADDGGLPFWESVACASICFQCSKRQSTRAAYVKWAEHGAAFTMIAQGQRVWDIEGNAAINALIHTGVTTVHKDSPGQSPSGKSLSGPSSATLASNETSDSDWYQRFLARHGYWKVVGYSNKLRVLLDDEDAATAMACRMVGPSGDLTPLELVRALIAERFRGCGDGYCWCSEEVPKPLDLSRSTGPCSVAAGVHPCRCQRGLDSDTRRWNMLCIWKQSEAARNPWLRLAANPSAVSVDDLRSVCEEVNICAPPEDDWPEPIENIQLGGMPINCTLRMARYATQGMGLARWLLNCNGAEQMKCAFVVWLSALSTEVRLELERFDLHRMSLKQWLTWDTECSLLIRRAAMVGRLKGEAWLQLRKVGSVCARHATVANYAGERRDRVTKPVLKRCLVANFEEEYSIWADRLAEHATLAVCKRNDHRTLREAWDMRAVSAPSGSSSCSALLTVTGRGSDCAAPSDRPSKKAVLSSLPWNWVCDGLQLLPVNYGRASTKPEPKNRARTLIATGDLTTSIADHALRGMEGSGNFGGMAATQRPDVIGRWIESAAHACSIKISADLDNQNWQHTLWELETMWRARARGFERRDGDAAAERAASCHFVANGFKRSVVRFEGHNYRVFTGMFSGHRGTTWDNTSDHEIDRQIALGEVARLGIHCNMFGVSESGDDEFAAVEKWEEAASYLQVQRMLGIRMNAKKQLVGRQHGEYLQRCVSDNAAPRQAVASIVCTLCTGNWYRPVGTWLNSALDTCCSNWLEASARGVPRTVAARMCGLVLDQLMVDRWHTKLPLKWRQYACSNESGAVLFAECPGFGDGVAPDLVVRNRPRSNWRSEGVSDYYETPEGRWLLSLLDKEWMTEQWKDSVAFDAHASCEMGYIREENSKIVAERWEKGYDFVEVPLGLPELRPAPLMDASAIAWVSARRSGRCITEEDNLAALGLGDREVTLLGGYDNIVRDLSPERLAKLRPVGKANRVDLGVALDTGLRAGLRMFNTRLPRFGVSKEDDPIQRTVVVVAAAHGAGISRLARRFRQESVARFDRVASAWCGESAYYRGYDGLRARRDVTVECARMVGARLKEGYRPGLKVLLCHEHPDAIVGELQRCGLQSYWYLYDPGEAERAKRIAMRRVAADVMRYMQSCWRNLYSLHGHYGRLDTEESVITIVRAVDATA